MPGRACSVKQPRRRCPHLDRRARAGPWPTVPICGSPPRQWPPRLRRSQRGPAAMATARAWESRGMGRVVAAYAYRCGCRVAEIQLGDSATLGAREGRLRLDRLPRADRAGPAHPAGAVRAARARDRGRAERASGAQARGLRRFAVRGAAHRRSSIRARWCSARPASSSARTTSSASAMAPRSPTCRCAQRCEASPKLLTARRRLRAARAARLSSSTTTCRWWRRRSRRSTRSRSGCSPASSSRGDIERIYELRRELVRLRRVAAPMVEVCSRLRHVELPFIDKNMRPYFKDVLDHVAAGQRDHRRAARGA